MKSRVLPLFGSSTPLLPGFRFCRGCESFVLRSRFAIARMSLAPGGPNLRFRFRFFPVLAAALPPCLLHAVDRERAAAAAAAAMDTGAALCSVDIEVPCAVVAALAVDARV